MSEKRIYVSSDLDIVVARMQAREEAKKRGFSTADQARISLAISELARVLSWTSHDLHEIVISSADKNGHRGLKVVCNVLREHIPTDGLLSGDGDTSMPSRTLVGACRLVDESRIEEVDDSDKCAQVTLIKWLK